MQPPEIPDASLDSRDSRDSGDSGRADPVRQAIRAEIEQIVPDDDAERRAHADALQWVASGAPLFRIAKPATPPKHLIAYFVVVDDDHVLLVDHINAQRWLPTGGHVDVNEHPRETVRREAKEELGLTADFVQPGPCFISVTQTVGLTAGHTDVSLWYVLRAARSQALQWDHSEFKAVRWFHHSDIPLARSDPQMPGFLAKLYPPKLCGR
ncbi:MAG: NUDIX hydrolase [Pseudomonadota bacterium]